jgi:hypothetical protein
METQDKTKTKMRDILQLAIVRLKLTRDVKALYSIAFQLTTGRDTFSLDLDSDKDIIDVLNTTLKEQGFMPLDMNSIKLDCIPVISFKLSSEVK